MRKFFTFLVACALLVVSGGFASAQQSLSKAEQDAIKNEVLPAVFEQIKEQAGIDILGWANPQLSDASISGFPVFDSGNVLRSGGSKTITLQPDSIIVTLPSSVPQVVATLLGGGYVKVTFAGYDKKEIPVGDYMMELNLPAQIKVASPKMDLFTLNFDSKLGEGKKLPFTMKVDMTVDNPLLQGVFEDKKLDLISLVVEHKEANFNAKLSLEAGLKKLAGMLENMLKSKVDLPDAFLLTVKLTELDNFRVPCSLFAVAGEITLPLGDAVIGLNLTGGFPLNYVEVTKYEKGKADEWIKLWMAKVDTDSKNIERLDVHKYKYKDAEMKDSTYQCSTAIIATKNLVTKMPTLLSKNIAQSLVANVANQMLSTQEYFPVGNLSIKHYDKEKDPEVRKPVFDADLSVAMGDKGVQYVKIKMTEYDEDGNDITYVKLSFMGEKKEMVKVDIIPDEETNPALVTAYISSNVYGVATNNEKIEAPSWTIIPAREGIRVQNIDKATYQIVSMTGATVSAGTIAGDVVIPTSSLVRGKYIFVVKANGIQQAVKFIH